MLKEKLGTSIAFFFQHFATFRAGLPISSYKSTLHGCRGVASTIRRHSQFFPDRLVDDVGYGDGRGDFEKVGSNPSIQSTKALLSDDLFEQF